MLFFITIDELIKQWDDPESIEVRVRRERVSKESIMKRSELERTDVDKVSLRIADYLVESPVSAFDLGAETVTSQAFAAIDF
jgi:hypothetical protein